MKGLARAISFLRILAGIAIVLLPMAAHGQSRRFDFSTHFTLLDVGERTSGFGTTLTYNATPRFAFESTLNFFPGDAHTNLGTSLNPVIGDWKVGNVLQGQFGAKANVFRARKAQFFVKVKPGFVSFSNMRYVAPLGIGGPADGDLTAPAGRQTSFALDIGGGAEFYPSPRTLFRFDIGDTYFRYNSFSATLMGATAGLGTGALLVFPGSSVHSLQISTGVGLRFGKVR